MALDAGWWDQVLRTLTLIVLIAFFLERALSLVFENRLFVQRWENKGVKEPIAYVLAIVICATFGFDALSALLGRTSTVVGYLITAGVIAGGSKAAVKLFRDVLDLKSTAIREAEAAQKRETAVQAVLQAGFRPFPPSGGTLL